VFAPESVRLPLDILVSIRCLLCEFQVLVDLARGLHDALNVLTAAHWPVKSTCFENHVLGKGAGECARAPLSKSPLPIRSVCCRGRKFAGGFHVLMWRFVLAHCGFTFLHFAEILWIDSQFRLNSRATGQVPGPSRSCTAGRDDQSQRSRARGGWIWHESD